MSEMETALMLRMEASLAKFEKQMARAKRSGTETSTALERKFAASNKKMARSAEASAMAIGREMDRLRSKYDPLFAASKRYEAELDELNRAHKIGALSMVQYEAALDRINADYTRASTGATKMSAGIGRLTTVTRGGAGGLQNIAYQVGDFATQVGSGQSASVALGQQLPQLLGGFGALGAVLGAVVAIGVPLTAFLLRSGEEAATMKDRLDALETAVNDYRTATERAFIPTAELSKKYGTATAAAREFLLALREIANVDALNKVDDAIGQTLSQFGEASNKKADEFIDVMKRVVEMRDKLGVGANAQPIGMVDFGNASADEIKAMFDELDRLEGYVQIVQRLGAEYDISAQKAEQVASALKRIEEADSTQEKANAARELRVLLESTLGPVKDMTAEQKKFYEWVVQSGEELAAIVGISQQAASGIGGAASEAGRLANELGRAVDNAINLAAQGVADLRRSEIELQYKDDPVGKAGALKAAEIDALAANAVPGTPPAEAIARNRATAIQAAEQTERNRQQLIAYRREQAKISKASSGGGSPGSSRKPVEDLFARSDDEMLQLERQMEMIGKTRAEVARMTAEYRLLDEARERGLDLDARQTATGETLRQEIERQSTAIGKLTETKDRALEKSQAMTQMQEQMKEGFIDAILEGENLAGVMESLAKSIAKAALEAALFGEGPFSDGGGGGLLGGLFKSIFNADGNAFQGGRVTAFARGGVVSSPTAFPMPGRNIGVMGEAGPEAIMPLTRIGGKLGVRAQGGGGVSGRVEVVARVENGNIVQTIRKVSGDVAVKTVRAGLQEYDRTQLPQSFERINNDPRARG